VLAFGREHMSFETIMERTKDAAAGPTDRPKLRGSRAHLHGHNDWRFNG
jgi:hypothetical protein